jgi:hypothetical protein
MSDRDDLPDDPPERVVIGQSTTAYHRVARDGESPRCGTASKTTPWRVTEFEHAHLFHEPCQLPECFGEGADRDECDTSIYQAALAYDYETDESDDTQ